jgi:hypothetical protein
MVKKHAECEMTMALLQSRFSSSQSVTTIPKGQLTLMAGTVGTAEHELIHIEAAAHAMLLLRHHSSQAVKLAVDRACDTTIARIAWCTTGAVLGTGCTVAGVILAPVAMPLVVAVAGGSLLFGSSFTAGYCTVGAVGSGVDLYKKKARCREGESLFQGSTDVYLLCQRARSKKTSQPLSEASV